MIKHSRIIVTVLALGATSAMADGNQVVTEYQGSPLVISGTREIDTEAAFQLPAKSTPALAKKHQALSSAMEDYAALMAELGQLMGKLNPDSETSEAATVLMAISIVKERLAELESAENDFIQAKAIDGDEGEDEESADVNAQDSDVVLAAVAH